MLYADAPRLSATLTALIRAQATQRSPASALQTALRAVALEYASDRQQLLLRTEALERSGSLRSHKWEHKLG